MRARSLFVVSIFVALGCSSEAPDPGSPSDVPVVRDGADALAPDVSVEDVGVEEEPAAEVPAVTDASPVIDAQDDASTADAPSPDTHDVASVDTFTAQDVAIDQGALDVSRDDGAGMDAALDGGVVVNDAGLPDRGPLDTGTDVRPDMGAVMDVRVDVAVDVPVDVRVDVPTDRGPDSGSCALVEGASCSRSSTTACCAGGRTCGTAATGEPRCCSSSGPCTIDSGCCGSTRCIMGRCQVPPSSCTLAVGARCSNSSSACCSARLVCATGYCASTAGGFCRDVGECGGGLNCREYRCCIRGDARCVSSSDCCSGLCRSDGTCRPCVSSGPC